MNHGETEIMVVTYCSYDLRVTLKEHMIFQEHVLCWVTYLAFGKSKVSGPVVGSKTQDCN